MLDLTYPINNRHLHYTPYGSKEQLAYLLFNTNIPEEIMREIAQMKPLLAVFQDGSIKKARKNSMLKEFYKTPSENTTLRVT